MNSRERRFTFTVSDILRRKESDSILVANNRGRRNQGLWLRGPRECDKFRLETNLASISKYALVCRVSMEVAYLKISYAQGRKICLAVALQLPAELVAELQPTKLLLGTSTMKHYIDRSMHGLCQHRGIIQIPL